MKLIGYAFLTGRIDFTREDNPWAFQRIDAGMKQSQKDRIRVDPAQAPIELRSADVNGDEHPDWLESMELILRSAESMYLQYKSGVLRFRRANHPAGKDKTYVTLGNQDEVDLYAEEHWRQIRYLYAQRRPGAFCFDVNKMISHKPGGAAETKRIELPARLDLNHTSGEPQFTFLSSGSEASVEIIDWRKSVKEGEIARFQPDNTHLEIVCKSVLRPFTFLHENRVEFQNHSYTFAGDEMLKLDKVIKKRLAEIERDLAEQASEQSDSEQSS